MFRFGFFRLVFALLPPLRTQRRQQFYEPMTAKRFWGHNVFIQATTPSHLAVLWARRHHETVRLKEKFSSLAARCESAVLGNQSVVFRWKILASLFLPLNLFLLFYVACHSLVSQQKLPLKTSPQMTQLKWLNILSASPKGPLVSTVSIAPTQYAHHKTYEVGFIRDPHPGKQCHRVVAPRNNSAVRLD